MIKCMGKSGDKSRRQEVRRDCVKVQAFQETGLGESRLMWHLIEKLSWKNVESLSILSALWQNLVFKVKI